MMGLNDVVRTTLAPGPGLEGMDRVMLRSVEASFDKLCAHGQPKKIQLQQWLGHEMTMATTEAVYGPENPYKDPKVEAAFW